MASPRPRSFFQRFFPLIHLVTRFAVRLFAPRLRYSGKQYIPHYGPVIIAPNHVSDVDPPIVAATLTRHLWFMAKRSLFDIRILGPGMRFYQAFPIDPGAPDREALKFAANLLQQGQAVVIFPEGKISETGEMGPLLPGAVSLALRAGVPVIPCGIVGSGHILSYGHVVPHPTLHAVHIAFGPPLKLDDLKALPRREAREAAAHRLETAIRACIKRAS